MTKIAYNNCFGGFDLSDAAFEAFLNRKGIAWEKRPSGFVSSGFEYFRAGEIGVDGSMLFYGDFDEYRADPDLIAVIEEMGAAANGDFSSLAIAEIPEGTRYRIDEYDGNETVMTADDYDWSVA